MPESDGKIDGSFTDYANTPFSAPGSGYMPRPGPSALGSYMAVMQAAQYPLGMPPLATSFGSHPQPMASPFAESGAYPQSSQAPHGLSWPQDYGGFHL